MSTGQGGIPESIIESVLQQNDIVDTVSRVRASDQTREVYERPLSFSFREDAFVHRYT